MTVRVNRCGANAEALPRALHQVGHVRLRCQTEAVAREMHVLGRAHYFSVDLGFDPYALALSRAVHPRDARGPVVTRAVARQHIIAGPDLLDRPRRPVRHLDRPALE